MASNSAALVIPATNQVTTNLAQLDIRPIKDPVPISSGWEWLWWSLGLLAAAAIGYILWRRWKNRPRALAPKLMIPPHRRAKERLRGAQELLSDPYAFCTLVSDVLREYLENRFAFHAPERTTEEFLGEMSLSDRLSPDQKQTLEHFLMQCDLVKFAKEEPTEGELRALLETAERFIDETASVGEQTVSGATSEKQAA